MIELTRLDDSIFVINCELIETIEETPDTVISTTSGKRYIVKESIDEIIEMVIKYKRKIFSGICKEQI
ncbi:MAG TPA: flagellar FlbD family protein [Clostridiaceae bacterium]|nr:flagellar FlbD family protein [Clostridiaceae bacterium]